MEKYISSNDGFEVLDKLMAKIQANNYHATQKMLDTAWSEWIKLRSVNEKVAEYTSKDLRKKEIADGIPTYRNYSKHKDLISFCVCSEYFTEDANFDELIVVVEKRWLFNLIKKTQNLKTDSEVRKFLQEEYTSEESKDWYDEAILDGKIITISFN